jgi:hypothetical protein
MKLILGLLLVGPVVVAQPATQPPATAPPAAQPPAAPPPAQADIGVKQQASLSPQEMTQQGRTYRQRITESQARVQSQADEARKSKDIIRVNCILDKLTQIKANAVVADQALQSLQEAAVRNDEGASLHEFTRVTIVNQKVQVLQAESDACIGEDLSYVGATRVDVEVTGVDPTDYTRPGSNRPPLDRPPPRPLPVSPFR